MKKTRKDHCFTMTQWSDYDFDDTYETLTKPPPTFKPPPSRRKGQIQEQPQPFADIYKKQFYFTCY